MSKKKRKSNHSAKNTAKNSVKNSQNNPANPSGKGSVNDSAAKNAASQNKNAKTGVQKGNKASDHAAASSEGTNTVSKMKRFLSLTGVVLLLALYLLTFILAIVDNSASLQLFYASVVATILIPILIWGYTLIYRLFNKEDKEDNQQGA